MVFLGFGGLTVAVQNPLTVVSYVRALPELNSLSALLQAIVYRLNCNPYAKVWPKPFDGNIPYVCAVLETIWAIDGG